MLSQESVITLIAAVLAFGASVIAIVASSYHARFRRFAMERWWERKADAYTQIIEALADLVNYYRQFYDAELEARELSEKRVEEITQRWKEGYGVVMKATDTGAFLISAEAEASLRRFREGPQEKPHRDDWFQRFENNYILARQCLDELVKCSKTDLLIS